MELLKRTTVHGNRHYYTAVEEVEENLSSAQLPGLLNAKCVFRQYPSGL